MNEVAPTHQRPRILFADDQRGVARTLSTHLRPLNAEIRFAEDGEVALQKLQSEVFDLAVIDLSMPPAEWGGLWLLRELARHGIRTPSIVLSGEAGQAETIEALRNGASQFVVKDRAADELHDIVCDELVAAAQSHWQFATTRLPTPVALPLIRSQLHTDYVHRLRSHINCVESIFRFTALATAAAGGRIGRDLLAANLARPSMGTWRTLCRKLQQEITAPQMQGWLTAVGTQSGGALTSLRNDLHHGTEATPAWARLRLPEVAEWIAHFANVAATRPGPRIAVAGAMEHTGSKFVVDIAELAGEATAVQWYKLEVEQAMIKGRVYLLSDEIPPILLWPMVIARPTDRLGHWSISVLDSCRTAASGRIAESDELRFINLTLGVRENSENRVADLLGQSRQ